MRAMASQITSRTIVYSTVYFLAVYSALLAPARGTQWQVKFPAQGQVRRKMLPFDDVIMQKHGYTSKHQESVNKSYWLPILERRTMTPSKRCLLLIISLKCHPHQEKYGVISRLFAIWNQCRSLPAKNCLLNFRYWQHSSHMAYEIDSQRRPK